jgi:hypothetical protein
VDWPVGADVVITSTEFKDSREHNYNEVLVISSVECLSSDAQPLGKVTFTAAVAHRHYAGLREYQAEVGLLTRRIRLEGDAGSEPTDTPTGRCTHIGRVGEPNGDGTIDQELFTIIPCTEDHYLTGYGGHVMIKMGAVARVSSVEFFRMGQVWACMCSMCMCMRVRAWLSACARTYAYTHKRKHL